MGGVVYNSNEHVSRSPPCLHSWPFIDVFFEPIAASPVSLADRLTWHQINHWLASYEAFCKEIACPGHPSLHLLCLL